MLNKDGHISISTGTFIRASLIVLCIYLFWFLRDFLLIILASIIIASFVESIVPYFKKIHITRIWAVVILYILMLIILGLLIYLFVPILISEIFNFYDLLSGELHTLPFLNDIPKDTLSNVKDIISGFSKESSLTDLVVNSKVFFAHLTKGLAGALSVTLGSLINFALIVIISFYFSIEEEGIENFLKVVSPKKYENYVVDLWKRSRRKIALWVKGQILLAILVAIVTYLVLALLEVQYALLLALMVGVMNIVPYGTLISLIPATIISYFSGGTTTAIFVALAYIVINQFENFLFSPIIIKGTVGLSPLIVLLSAIIGFKINGIWGLVLAIPITVILVEFFTDIEKQKNIQT